MEGRDSLLGAAAGSKRQLLLQGRLGQEEEGLHSLWRVELLYALVRLAGRLLPSSPSSSSSSLSSEPAAAALAFLQRAAAALDLREAWQEAAAAAGAAAGGGGGAGGLSTEGMAAAAAPSSLTWAARRLLVRTEGAVLQTLLSAAAPSSAPSVRAQARCLLPLCGPGQEWEAHGLVVLGIDDDGTEGREDRTQGTTLRRLFASVLADEGALAHGRLLVGEKGPCPARASLLVSPRLSPPHTLLPLPPHWLLLPLASSLAPTTAVAAAEEGEEAAGQAAAAATATTRRILHATLRYLLRQDGAWHSYTALLPPGLPLYHLLCLGLFPYEAFAGPAGSEVRA